MGIHDGHRARMRRRFLQTGLDGFADHEALELLLFYVFARRDTNPAAHALLDRYGSLSAVFAAPVEDLQRVSGVGEQASLLLTLVYQLCRRIRLDKVGQLLDTTERQGEYLLERYAGTGGEAVFQLCLDRNGRLLACRRLGSGGASWVEADLREMLENAILTSAAGVVISHNHPSGVAVPSQADYAATDRIRRAMDSVDVVLLDHIIVAGGDFLSLRESGYL